MLTILYATISMVAFLIGYSIKFSSNNINKKNVTYSSSFIVLIAIFLELIIILSALYLIQYFGGLSNVISMQSALVKAIPESGFIIKLAWIFILVSFLPISLLLSKYGISKWVLFVLFINITFCLILGRRLPILGLILPFVIYYHFYIRRFSIEKGVFMFLGFIILMVSIVTMRISNSAAAGMSIIEDSAEFFIWDMVLANINAFNEEIEGRKMLDFIPYWLRNLYDLDWFSKYPSIGEALVSIHFPTFPAGNSPWITRYVLPPVWFFKLIYLLFLFWNDFT